DISDRWRRQGREALGQRQSRRSRRAGARSRRSALRFASVATATGRDDPPEASHTEPILATGEILRVDLVLPEILNARKTQATEFFREARGVEAGHPRLAGRGDAFRKPIEDITLHRSERRWINTVVKDHTATD